jgi:hypothetical protein
MKPSDEPWNPDDWFHRCAWCEEEIPEGHEVLGVPAKLRPEQVRKEWAGTIQPLRLVWAQRTLPMMVVSEDSPAKRDGKDAMFMVCSDSCGRALQAALRKDIDLGNTLDESPRGD